jgi:hypothetical protein
MDDKVTINLKTGEKPGELVETTPDGKEERYFLHPWGVRFIATELQLIQYFESRSSGDASTPSLSWGINGKAWLEDDYGVAPIGEPKLRTRVFELQIRASEQPDLLVKQHSDGQDVLGDIGMGTFGQWHLGFYKGDWESRTEDTWYLALYFHSATLQPLIDAIKTRRLRQLALNGDFRDLYSDAPPYVPLGPSHLFLRPMERLNDSYLTARGFVEGMLLRYEPLDVRPPAEPDDAGETPSEPVAPVLPPDPMLVAIQDLTLRIEATRKTIKWVVGICAAALLILALK